MKKTVFKQQTFYSIMFFIMSITQVLAVQEAKENLGNVIERQLSHGLGQQDELKTTYLSLCMKQKFNLTGSDKKSICNRAADILLETSLLRRITLQQYRLLNIEDCMRSYGNPEAQCEHYNEDYERVFENSLSLALCGEAEASLLFEEGGFYTKRGDNVYEDLELAIYCQSGFFVSENENNFLINPSDPRYLEDSLYYSLFQSDIAYNYRARFEHRLQSLDIQALNQSPWSTYLIETAINSDNPYFLDKLLDKGVNIKNKFNYYNQPITIALENKKQAYALKLLERGSPLDIPNQYSVTPLSMAAANNYLQLAKKLLEAKVNVHGQTEDVRYFITPPVIVAAEKGYEKMVELLFDHGASVKSGLDYYKKNNPLIAAARGGSLEIFNRFVREGASLSDNNARFIKATLEGCNPEILQALINMGLSLPQDKHRQILSDLFENVRKSNPENKQSKSCDGAKLLAILLKYGLKVDYEEGSAFRLASQSLNFHWTIHFSLNSREPGKQEHGRQLILFVLDTIDAALVTGMDINYSDKAGNTLLMKAALWGMPEIVEYLLSRGAQKQLKNKRKENALDLALMRAKKVSNKPDYKNRYDKTIHLLGDK